MGIKFDTYSFRARVLPVYLTLSPIVLLLVAIVPEGLRLPIGGAAALVFAPISFFLGQVGADFGKRLEKGLWEDLRRLASSGTATVSSTRLHGVACTRSSANLGSKFQRARNKSMTRRPQIRTISHARRTSFVGQGMPASSRSYSRASRSTASAETCSA